MKIETKDNFIEDKELFKSIKDTLFGSEIPWYHSSFVGDLTDHSGYFFIHHLHFENKFRRKNRWNYTKIVVHLLLFV